MWSTQHPAPTGTLLATSRRPCGVSCIRNRAWRSPTETLCQLKQCSRPKDVAAPATEALTLPERKQVVNPVASKMASSLIPLGLGSSAFFWASSALAMQQMNFTVPGVLGDSPLSEGLVSSFLLILFSEIGDKTFFIAVLLSLQNSQSAVFTGTFGALAIMTVISVAIGQAFHQLDDLLPANISQFPVDDLLAVALLVFFGLATLKGAQDADDTAEEEKKEAEEVVSGLASGAGGLILSTFALVFAAEWGDKSFLATTALSAASSPLGVCLGAIAGHAVATIIAVLGGSFLSDYLSEKTVQYIGGALFLVFAAGTAIDLVQQV